MTKLCCCKQLPSNVTVPVSYVDSHSTDFSLCRKGNDIQTHEVGSLGLSMTPSFGILFFTCVYSALSYSCILHNKIIYSSPVFCLLGLQGRKKEKRAFSFVQVAVFPISPASCQQRHFTRKNRGLSSLQQPLSTGRRSCDFHCSF